MRKLVSFNVSILVDEQNEGVIEVLGDEINMDDVVKVTVERIND